MTILPYIIALALAFDLFVICSTYYARYAPATVEIRVVNDCAAYRPVSAHFADRRYFCVKT
jgi:hypothetical protein